MHFNSHAHVERDFIRICRTLTIGISTHTLTWSVTHSSKYTLSAFSISTHTLTWSVTPTEEEPTEEEGNFNSHAHVERDGFNEQ